MTHARLLLALAVVHVGAPAHAQTALRAGVVASGATGATGGAVRLRGTVGQAAVGLAAGGGHTLGQGFWPAATAGAGPAPTPGETYVVTSTADPGAGTCDAAECTLREAILASNASALNDRIHFAIPGAGVRSITPLTPLPAITDTVVVDGYTQPGASPNTLAVGNDAVLRVELNGNGAAFRAVEITAGGSTVRGLVINRFSGNGPSDAFRLRTRGGNTVAGNWVGLGADGTTELNNGRAGVYVQNSAGNVIGGTAPADRNVILGGANPALYDEGTGGGHAVQGNYFGTNAQGTAMLGNAGLQLTTANNLVGGTAPGAGNVIALGAYDGVRLNEGGATGNTVQGNLIGVGSDGTTRLGSATSVQIQRGTGNLIGGTTPGARNVLGGAQGVVVVGVSGVAGSNTIQGNYIGLNAAGTALLASGTTSSPGVLISSATDNLVGGAEPGAGNVIAGFAVGVQILTSSPTSTGNVVQGNRIGTNAAGTAALPNGVGVSLLGGGGSQPTTGNLIGGAGAGMGNLISGNTGDGVSINGAVGNTVQGNLIGVAADGAAPLGNGGDGVSINFGNGVGGQVPGAGNTIAHNGRAGAGVSGGVGIAIQGNAIFQNGTLGIDLVGAAANDPGDADDGPNRLQNTPVLDAVGLRPGAATVTYRVDTAPANAAYPLRVEFFVGRAGEGAVFLGADSYSEDDYTGCAVPPCPTTATFAPTGPLIEADSVVATATDAAGNTSEFTPVAVRPVAADGGGSLAETALWAPAPNPARGQTTLRFSLGRPGPVRLSVVDLLGREVAVVVDAERPAGAHAEILNGSRLAAGVYVVRLRSGGAVHTRRLVVAR